MASLFREHKDGGWRIAWTDHEGKRKGIRIGKMNERTAQRFLDRVEMLVVATRGGGMDAETRAWLDSLDDRTHDRLVRAGIAVPRHIARPTLDAMLKQFDSSLAVKDGTRVNYTHVAEDLRRAWGADRLLDGITTLDAERWVDDMRKRELAPPSETRYTDRVISAARDHMTNTTSNAVTVIAAREERYDAWKSQHAASSAY